MSKSNLKKTALIAFIIGCAGIALIVVDDFMGTDSILNLPIFIIYLTWIIGLGGIILNVVYSFRIKYYPIGIIFIIASFPWIFPVLFLTIYGGISILAYIVFGLLLHFKSKEIVQYNDEQQ